MTSRRQDILNTVEDLLSGLLYYDRKEDEDLPRGAIEDAIIAQEVSVSELKEVFGSALLAAVKRRAEGRD
jgi:hypothetical protein